MGQECDAWATEEFGSANLGDVRRRRRLVKVAGEVAKRPAGRITEALPEGASRTAAFRLMENEEVSEAEIALAAHRACAWRSADQPFVFVPIDGSSLNLTDDQESKGLGIVGARRVGAKGLQVMTAIAVSSQGVPLGLCGQTWWTRQERVERKNKHDRRLVKEKETQHWLTVMNQVRTLFAAEAPHTRPWLQLDRGGDAWPVVLEGLTPEMWFTVRAARDRRLDGTDDEPRRYLWQTVESSEALGRFDLAVPARAGRPARTATIEVRGCPVTLDLLDLRSKQRHWAALWAVLAREVDAPDGEDGIEWLLLSTYEVSTLDDARLVIYGYAQRWRIEEFHKMWKSGACRVEDTQLREREAIIRWASILASVAMRILRLTRLSRTTPDEPALIELTQAEIDAAIVARKPKGYRRGDVPSISLVVRWIADLGGYTGKSSGGPPGAIVIRRGLDRIQSLADFFATDGKM
jgi:hypothetical protein